MPMATLSIKPQSLATKVLNSKHFLYVRTIPQCPRVILYDITPDDSVPVLPGGLGPLDMDGVVAQTVAADVFRWAGRNWKG